MFCTHAQFFHFRRPLKFRPVDLSTFRPVNLSTCHLQHGYIWSLYSVAGVWGACPYAFRCESMPTPLNLTYILPYDCPCFARMCNSFTSVDLFTVDLSTCRPVNLSTCRPVNLSTSQPVDLSTFCWLLLVYNTPQMCYQLLL